MSKYSLSVEMATAELLKLAPAETACNAGGVFNEDNGLLTIQFIDRPVAFDFGQAALIWGDSGEAFEATDSIAILHYLVNAKGERPSGKLLAYRDLWGAGAQSGPFIDRPEKILAAKYGEDPGFVINQAEKMLAAVVEKYGDARLDIPALPHLPLTVLLYAADDALPAGVKILFDSVTSLYLPTEDAVWLSEYVAQRLAG